MSWFDAFFLVKGGGWVKFARMDLCRCKCKLQAARGNSRGEVRAHLYVTERLCLTRREKVCVDIDAKCSVIVCNFKNDDMIKARAGTHVQGIRYSVYVDDKVLRGFSVGSFNRNSLQKFRIVK